VTGFHPEHWQPAWGVRTMLLAIRDHFMVEDRAAIGYLDFPTEDRRVLAEESKDFRCNHCGYRPVGMDIDADTDEESEGLNSNLSGKRSLQNEELESVEGSSVVFALAGAAVLSLVILLVALIWNTVDFL